MTKRLLKVAIIGCGRMGLVTDPKVMSSLPEFYIPLSHADATMLHPNLVLAGLCDTSEEALIRAKERYPKVPSFNDPEKLLQDLEIDLVCIATRTPARFQLIQLCFRYGIKLIHVEKPLCNSYKQLIKIQDQLKKNNAHITFGAIRRYLSPYKKSIDILNKGEIGDLKEVSLNLGSTLLCWNHIHGIDLIQFVLNQYNINSVRAVAKNYKKSKSQTNILDGDPEIAFIHFATKGGPQGLISCAGGCDFMLYGDKGIIGVLNDGMNCFLRKSFVGNNESSYWTNSVKIDLPEDNFRGTASALDRLVKSNSKLSKIDNDAIISSQKLLFASVQSILLNGDSVDPNYINEDIYITGKSGEFYA